MTEAASPQPHDTRPLTPGRRAYLDWCRGLAVLTMIGTHATSSWTSAVEQSRPLYRWVLAVGGLGAPMFLFLAGVALSLAAGSRVRRGAAPAQAAAHSARRGLRIFGLAFLFQLQSWVVSGGHFADKMLRVDILHVIGVSMLLGAAVWRLGSGRRLRSALLAASGALVAMLTPVVRTTESLAWLPDAVQWYAMPSAGHTNFTLFPSAGFLLFGAAAGVWLEGMPAGTAERRFNLSAGVLGTAIAAAAYAASFLPSMYSDSAFWTSSPTFFFMRLGILAAFLPIAFGWNAVRIGPSPVVELGRASLFVYWIHVELVYGMPSHFIQGSLGLGQTAATILVFTALLYAAVRFKTHYWPPGHAARLATRDRGGGLLAG